MTNTAVIRIGPCRNNRPIKISKTTHLDVHKTSPERSATRSTGFFKDGKRRVRTQTIRQL